MTPPRGAFVALLALLSACGGRGPDPMMAGAELPPGHAECRAEARQAPELRELSRSYNPTNVANQQRLETQAAEIEARVFGGCLQRRGLASRGGVEPVRR
jgi:hypothetical protein